MTDFSPQLQWNVKTLVAIITRKNGIYFINKTNTIVCSDLSSFWKICSESPYYVTPIVELKLVIIILVITLIITKKMTNNVYYMSIKLVQNVISNNKNYKEQRKIIKKRVRKIIRFHI